MSWQITKATLFKMNVIILAQSESKKDFPGTNTVFVDFHIGTASLSLSPKFCHILTV